jgi:hypothetical protein
MSVSYSDNKFKLLLTMNQCFQFCCMKDKERLHAAGKANKTVMCADIKELGHTHISIQRCEEVHHTAFQRPLRWLSLFDD